MAWIYLTLAGILEVVWAFYMKQSDGFTKPLASFVTIITMIASFALLSMAMKTLPLSISYTIWTGIGTVGAFLVGLIILGEPTNTMQIIAAVMIVIGLFMMKLSS